MTPDILQLRRAVDQRLHQLAVARSTFKREKRALTEAKQTETDTREALVIAQKVAGELQEIAHRKITTVVTQALRAVFAESGDEYEFKVLFETKRNRTEARMAVMKNGVEHDPLDGSGGGLADVIGFCLRISALLLSRPPLRRFIAVDEVFKHLSSDYRPAMAEMVAKLSRELDVQIVLVTHAAEFAGIGKVVRI